MLERRTITVKRPRTFFRADGDLPEEVTLTLGLPPELGDVDELLESIRVRVAEVEDRMAAERAKTGRRAVRRQSWRVSVRSTASGTGGRRTAARNKWAGIEALQRNRDFLEAYRAAHTLWLAGAAVASRLTARLSIAWLVATNLGRGSGSATNLGRGSG